MFTIRGVERRTSRQVEVTWRSPAERRRPPGGRALSGDPRLVGELVVAAKDGTWFPVTPTGPDLRLDLDDGASVLCALASLLDHRGWTADGDVPDLSQTYPALPPGAFA